MLLVGCLLASCTSQPETAPTSASGFQRVALQFAVALAERRYADAYALTTRGYRARTSREQMRSAFEDIVPPSWDPAGPIELGLTQTSWPDKQPGDVGWVYVSIGGRVYSEGLVVILSTEDKHLRVRTVEFGRP